MRFNRRGALRLCLALATLGVAWTLIAGPYLPGAQDDAALVYRTGVTAVAAAAP